MNNENQDENQAQMVRVQLSMPKKMVNALQKRMHPLGIFASGDCIRYLVAKYLEEQRDKDIQ